MRKRVNPRNDQRKFNRTAKKSKKININPSTPRGGIRL